MGHGECRFLKMRHWARAGGWGLGTGVVSGAVIYMGSVRLEEVGWTGRWWQVVGAEGKK